ncbi:MAG: MATE family efflux transporter [Candidatus Marinimicrobia bacterium]|nr:MATE family efflux transporter [Candidatus Neomarinimicrobiota bacterium]
MLAIALPMVISHACDMVMTFTDRMFLSRLGPEIMNAAMGGGMTAMMMMTFFMGLIGYSTALVAQYLGAGRKGTCSRVTTQAFLIALAAYPVILLFRPLADRFFIVMELPAQQIEAQRVYFNILIYGTVAGLFRMVFSSYFSGIGRTRIVMFAGIGSMIINVGVNYVLIFGKLGFPAMGIRGAAYGTIIGGIFGVLILAVSYFSRGNRREFAVMQAFRFSGKIMKKLLYYGYPAGLEFILTFFAFNLMILIFHSMGSVTATATTIMFNWDMVSYVPLIGIEVAVTSLVGRYMGSGDVHTANRAIMSGLKTGAVYSSVVLVLFVFFPEYLAMVFRPAGSSTVFDEAVPTAVFMLRVASIYVVIEAAIATFIGALRGAGDTRWSMMASVVLHYLMVAGLVFVLKVLNMSAEAAWVVVVSVFFLFPSCFICATGAESGRRYI